MNESVRFYNATELLKTFLNPFNIAVQKQNFEQISISFDVPNRMIFYHFRIVVEQFYPLIGILQSIFIILQKLIFPNVRLEIPKFLRKIKFVKVNFFDFFFE
ncbi:hypothetical protein D3C86_1736130 [compost metagenome]